MAEALNRSELKRTPKKRLYRVYLIIALAAVVVSMCLGYVYWVGNEIVARQDPQAKVMVHMQVSLIGVCLITALLTGGLLTALFSRRMRDREALQAANQQLEVSEQQLQAVNQQLTASEQQAREQRDRAERYFSLARTMLVVLRRDGRVERINQKGCEVLGVDEHDAVDKDWFRHFLPESQQIGVRNVFDQMMAAEVDPVEFYENLIQNAGGEQRLIAWHNTLVHDDGGNIVGVLSSGEDITDRKQAEQEIQTFKYALESSSDAIGMSTPEGRHIYQNHTFDTLFGDIGNDPPATLYVDQNIGRQVFETAMNGDEWAGEVDMYHRDGEILNILLRAYPVEVEGSIVALVGVHTNITKRKQAEEALQQSELRLRQLIEAAPYGAFEYELLADDRLVFVGYNQAADRILNTDCAQFMGKTIEEAFPPLAETKIPAAYRRVATTGQRYEDEQVAYAHDQITGAYEISAFQTAPQRMAVLFRDITERRRATEALEKERSKVLQYQNQLRALVSQLTLSEERERKRLAVELHDGICQSLAMAKLKVDEQFVKYSLSPIHDLLQEMQQTLISIINDTRSLTNNLGTPMLQQMGLHVALEKWLDTEISAKHGIKTEVVDEGVPRTLNENTKTLLFRAVRELAVNVVKHAQAQTLTVTLGTCENELTLAIVDDGKGFDCAALTEQDFRKGGYGLFSIHERITYIGGDMTIDSSPGKGTQILLRLPLNGRLEPEKSPT